VRTGSVCQWTLAPERREHQLRIKQRLPNKAFRALWLRAVDLAASCVRRRSNDHHQRRPPSRAECEDRLNSTFIRWRSTALMLIRERPSKGEVQHTRPRTAKVQPRSKPKRTNDAVDIENTRTTNAAWLLKKHGAGGGTRTRTELSLQRILSSTGYCPPVFTE
jgi:hypothetical protein